MAEGKIRSNLFHSESSEGRMKELSSLNRYFPFVLKEKQNALLITVCPVFEFNQYTFSVYLSCYKLNKKIEKAT